jgi:hypothetical protein
MNDTNKGNNMTTTHADPKVLDNDNVLACMRDYWLQQHSQIVRDAKAQQLAKVRDEFCTAFGVTKEEDSDGEGGGSVQLNFPVGWTIEQAEQFAWHCLDLSLAEVYHGPGRYFSRADIGEHVDDGHPMIYVYWGLDI